MKEAIVQLSGVSTLSMGRHYEVESKDETREEYEKRTWRERLHYNKSDEVFIPPMMFKKTLEEVASYLSIKIPGKRNQTYTKKFKAAVLVTDPMMLGIKKDDVEGEWVFVPSDGKAGGGSRVNKCFPVIHDWSGTVKFYIMDSEITEAVFTNHLTEAGKFIGIGRFRPIRGGYYGRFSVDKVEFVEIN